MKKLLTKIKQQDIYYYKDNEKIVINRNDKSTYPSGLSVEVIGNIYENSSAQRKTSQRIWTAIPYRTIPRFDGDVWLVVEKTESANNQKETKPTEMNQSVFIRVLAWYRQRSPPLPNYVGVIIQPIPQIGIYLLVAMFVVNSAAEDDAVFTRAEGQMTDVAVHFSFTDAPRD